MLSVEGTARADVMLTADRTYYRFATVDSVEDGELPGHPDTFDAFAGELLAVFNDSTSDGAPIDPVRFTIFVNSTRVTPLTLNNDTLRTFIEKMARYAEEFAFMRGFE